MAAIPSFGSSLKMGPTTSGAYTAPSVAVGEVTSLNLDGLTAATIDVSNITSRFRQFIPGIIDSGTISCEVNLDADDTQQAAIIDLLDASASAPTPRSFLLEYGDANNKGAKFECVGIVTSMSFKGAVGEAVTASISIKLTGSINFVDVDA